MWVDSLREFKTLRGMRDFLPRDMIKRERILRIIRKVFESYGFEPLETPAIEYWEVLSRKCGEEVREFKTLRGMRDFLPRDMIKRERILRIIRKIFESYGFEPLETPAIEYWEVLSRKCGEEVKKQIFKFKDKGGRDVGLRFDLTVPFARVVAQNPYLPKPFKRYCISRVWRYERPQTGRYREFWQADADIAGSPLPDADAEVIAVGVDALKALGLDNIEVRLNNRKILEGMAVKAGVPGELKLVFQAIRFWMRLDLLISWIK